MKITQEDNLLLQTHITTSFLFELINQNFTNSDYYKNMYFDDIFVKDNLLKVGIDNQGTLLMILYAMLVVPKQLLEQDFPNEFAQINKIIEKVKART